MIRKKLMTVAMAAMFAASSLAMPVAAMAEETTTTVEATEGRTVTHDGDVKVENDRDADYYDQKPGVQADSKSTVTQNGNVTVKNGDGVSSEGGKVTVKGNVSAEGEDGKSVDGVYVTSGDNEEKNSDTTRGDVTVTGDVTATSDYADGVNASDGTATVNGNVKATGESAAGVRAESDEIPDYDNSYARKENVKVNGNVTAEGSSATGVCAGNQTGTEKDKGQASVTVNGNVSASGGDNIDGVLVFEGGVVNVTGDISINLADTETDINDISSGINASGNGSATVKGNVTATGNADREKEIYIVGINLRDDGTVSVTGNVTSSDIGAAIGIDSGSKSTLVVDGTLKGEDSALHFYNDKDEEDSSGNSFIYPQILVTTLETGENGDLISTDTEGDGQLNQETLNAIKASIQYIIHADGFTTNGQTVTVNGQSYTVAKKGDTVTLTPSVPSGYKLTGLDFGSYQTTVKDNGDGTYQVVVREDGDLIFKANMEKIGESITSSGEKTAKTSTTSSKSSSSTGNNSNSSSSGKTTSPKTGDNANTATWVVVFAAALVGIGASLRGARKNHR